MSPKIYNDEWLSPTTTSLCPALFPLTVALLLIHTSVYGEWTELVSSSNEILTIYADKDTIDRNENLVKVWQLFDFKTTQTSGGKPYLSVKMHNEFDCGGLRSWILSLAQFSGNMGSGKELSQDSREQQWVSGQPASLARILLTIFCDKK
ncbi:surface-adhesin E family protein [Nitrospira sp. KM1]|uniref:surface-adhesin E family protein n=1 Tax=Nitrospira sp. KM1 TaxID=1936990 RepID=UPI001563283A|nr:surface-adhesin E family protein [Nitrospira sp. KM1]